MAAIPRMCKSRSSGKLDRKPSVFIVWSARPSPGLRPQVVSVELKGGPGAVHSYTEEEGRLSAALPASDRLRNINGAFGLLRRHCTGLLRGGPRQGMFRYALGFTFLGQRRGFRSLVLPFALSLPVVGGRYRQLRRGKNHSGGHQTATGSAPSESHRVFCQIPNPVGSIP